MADRPEQYQWLMHQEGGTGISPVRTEERSRETSSLKLVGLGMAVQPIANINAQSIGYLQYRIGHRGKNGEKKKAII